MGVHFSRLAIIGVGLIGSSIARAAQQANCCGGITIIECNPDHLAEAESLRLGDRFSHDVTAAHDADLVILATPSGSFRSIVKTLAPSLRHGAILSDTGSVKAQVLKDLSDLIPRWVHLIPAHPVAGTEHSGPAAGTAGLFRNRYTLITPPPGTDEAQIAHLEDFWRALGSIPEIMNAEHHDRVLAMTSHLPHFISFAMVHTAEHLEDNLQQEHVDDVISKTEVMKYSAGGFRDLTRIAHADPAMWRDVFLYNRDAVLEMLHRFQQDLSALAAFTARGDAAAIERWVHDSRRIRLMIQDLGQAGKMVYNEDSEADSDDT
ncbi:MAG: prephenate dehydrogenase/arogenate dehydrogenase family protein [Alphaproteobacteria bacterium]|nr:prephenate dehydrogenase/arogenate dehydrogenase family protein [Alphaproteobacteria bacterium]